jgi:hypothetical protein
MVTDSETEIEVAPAADQSSEDEAASYPEAAAAAARKVLEQDLQDHSEENATDVTLSALNWQAFPALRHARAKLTVENKDKKLDVFF